MADKQHRAPIALAGLLGLVVGYFAGREHLKFELRSTIEEAISRATDSLKENPALSNSPPATSDQGATQTASAPPDFVMGTIEFLENEGRLKDALGKAEAAKKDYPDSSELEAKIRDLQGKLAASAPLPQPEPPSATAQEPAPPQPPQPKSVPPALIALIEAREKLGRYEEALERTEKALDEYPDSAELLGKVEVLREKVDDLRRKADEAKAEEEKIRQRANAIKISIREKEFIPTDLQRGRFQEVLQFEFGFQSSLERNARAFTGTVVFLDLFDREIMRIGITIEQALPAGGSISWSGGIDYNQFMDDHRTLRAKELKDLQARFELKSVIYSDGTRENFKQRQ